MTGEQSPNVGESGTARQIISEISQGDINWEIMSQAQENARNGVYSGIMLGFIEWLQNTFLNHDAEAWIDILRSEFEKLRTDWSKRLKGTVHPRIPSMLAFLQLGFKYFLEFCKSCNVLDEALAKERMNEFIDVLTNMALKHAKLSHEDKPAVKFISAVKDLIVSEKVYIRKIGDFSNEKDYSDLIRFFNDEFYYFIPGTMYKQVYAFCEKQGDHFPLSKKALFRQLAEEKLIITEERHNTVNRKIKGTTATRFLCFPKEKFDNFEVEF